MPEVQGGLVYLISAVHVPAFTVQGIIIIIYSRIVFQY